MNGLTKAASDVLAERAGQAAKGYDDEHDDGHDGNEITAAAAYYAMPPAARDWPATETGYGDTFGEAIAPTDWTMKDYGDRRRELVVAAALLLAEIERMDRADGVTATAPTCLSPNGKPRRCVPWKCHEAKACARGVPASAPTRWCPECRSAGVVGIEQDVCPTCDGTGKVAPGVATARHQEEPPSPHLARGSGETERERE